MLGFDLIVAHEARIVGLLMLLIDFAIVNLLKRQEKTILRYRCYEHRMPTSTVKIKDLFNLRLFNSDVPKN